MELDGKESYLVNKYFLVTSVYREQKHKIVFFSIL